MDTLGTITARIADSDEETPNTEAFERLAYLGRTGGLGVLFGASGTGKSWLLSELAKQLRREAIAVAELNLTGMAGTELPGLIARRLGLGTTNGTPEFELWARLQEYAEAREGIRRPMAFLVDHLDQARESTATSLSRLLELFRRDCGWILSCRTPCQDRWTNLLQDRSWLRVEMQELQPRESAQILGRELAKSEHPIRMTPEAVATAHQLSAGKIRRLRLLAELSSIAAEAEQLTEIDEELLYKLAAELTMHPV